MSMVVESSAHLIAGISEMSALYGQQLEPKDQRFYRSHASALRCALRYPSDVAVYDKIRDRDFPPEINPDIDPVTELGALAAQIETLRDTTTTVSFKRGVVLETCGLLESFFLETLAELPGQQAQSHTVPYIFPSVIIVDSDGKPIGLRKTAGARTTLMTDGIDTETEALAGAVVRLSETDGHDLTYAVGTSTKNPDLTAVTLRGLQKVVVDRYSTFVLSPEYVKGADYGKEATRITLEEVRNRVNHVAALAGIA